MCACTAASVEDAANNLLEELNSGAKCLCVEHDASDDVAPALLRAARARVEAGSNVRVVCADAVAAARFRALAADDPLLSALDVVSARELALSILGDARVGDAVGRDARVLDENELAVLMEDVKVSGLKPGRLREMLKFFYRSWTELADDDPDWLLPGEEADVHTLLKENLVFMRAVIEPEAANLAARYLREHDEARAAHSYAHVLMDDYACASRASQTLANLVATCSITVAGDAETCIETYDSYPYAAGIDEFLATHPDAACEHLDADAPDAVERVALASDTPEAEFEQVARTVAEAVAAGTPARQIVVAVPNSVWSRNIATALHARGVPTEALAISQPLRGDVRDNARCTPARIATALNLVANPDDTAAWRCWCGFGDYLVNSAAFARLRTCAKERSIGLVDALEMLSENDCEHVVGAQRVATAYKDGRALIEQVRGLRGTALLDELTRIVTDGAESQAPAVLRELCLEHGNAADENPESLYDADAAAMARRMAERLLAPTLEVADAVAVVPYDFACGFSPDLLIVAGFVNGFIPSRDYFDATVTPPERQEKMRAVDERRVRALTGKGRPRGGAVVLHVHRPRKRRQAEAQDQSHPPQERYPHLHYRAQPIPGANRSAGVAATGVAFADPPI